MKILKSKTFIIALILLAIIGVMYWYYYTQMPRKISAGEGRIGGELKTMNGMFATFKKLNYHNLEGKPYPIGNDPDVLNSGKYCGLFYEVTNHGEPAMKLSVQLAEADYRSSLDPEAKTGSYIPTVKDEKGNIKVLDKVTFTREPLRGYWFALMKFYNDGEKKIPYDHEFSKSHYGLVCWPVVYGETGENTYIINEEGTVYQKDLEGAGYIDTWPGPKPWEHGWEIAE